LMIDGNSMFKLLSISVYFLVPISLAKASDT
jgi:hypothetical protein